MRKLSLFAGLAVACSSSLFVQRVDAELPRELVRFKTLQSLAAGPEGFFAKYLAIDQSGNIKVNSTSGRSAAETQWEIHEVKRRRDYVASVIRSRGDNRFNGDYLEVDGESGQLRLNSEKTKAAEWLVRYAGRYRGYHTYYIQTLLKSDGGFDMWYLGIDKSSGEVVLSEKPNAETNWFLHVAPELPTAWIK